MILPHNHISYKSWAILYSSWAPTCTLCTVQLYCVQAGILISLLSTWLPAVVVYTVYCTAVLFTGGNTHLLAEHLAASAVVVYTVYCTAVLFTGGNTHLLAEHLASSAGPCGLLNTEGHGEARWAKNTCLCHNSNEKCHETLWRLSFLSVWLGFTLNT
jgi:hypothetical protein